MQVKEDQLRRYHHRDLERLTAQLNLDKVELHAGPGGRLELTCLSTIPAFLGPEHTEYADLKNSSITGRVHKGVDMSCLKLQIKYRLK
jgi:hypothetical protein